MLIILILLEIFCWKQSARKMEKEDIDLPTFDLSTIVYTTNHFSSGYKLGEWGFGPVYKVLTWLCSQWYCILHILYDPNSCQQGVLADGTEIAVKRLFFNNKHRAADFYNEVNIISSVEHKNLVRLLGCSCSGPESLLVYEFMPNQSLDRFIFGKCRFCTYSPWAWTVSKDSIRICCYQYMSPFFSMFDLKLMRLRYILNQINRSKQR